MSKIELHLDATTGTADTISVNNAPTEDTHVVNKKSMEECVENILLNGSWQERINNI